MGLSPDKIRVGVLRGGPSPEYDVSLKTGKEVLEHLYREHYEPVDIHIDKQGRWHEGGLEKSPHKLLGRIDVVWNAMHGKYGEDGEVQRLLENFNIPYTGSNSYASALAMNKHSAKKVYSRHGIKTPAYAVINTGNLSRESIREIYNQVPMPFVVKPGGAGSSFGVYVVYGLPDLEEAIVASSEYSPYIIVEEYIDGKEATCGVVDGWRGEEYHALMPIEIRPKNHFFDFESKYSDQGAEEICPGNFSDDERVNLAKMAIEAHKILGLRHYSRSDFRIHPKRGIFILETNTLPGLTKESLLPKALKAAGANISDFLHHIIERAKGGK